MEIKRDDMLMKLGAAWARTPTGWRLVIIEMDTESSMFIYSLNRQKLRQVRQREEHCQLHSKLTEADPSLVWNYYLQLV
jgi:hypothetical protein